MAIRLAEVIRDRLGWCPDRCMFSDRIQRDPVQGTGNRPENLSNPRPWGTGRPEDPWDLRYEHTQQATVIIGSVVLCILVLLLSLYLFGQELVVLFVLVIMVFLLAIMSRLTVSVSSDALRIRFGPVGLIRKEWPLSEIVSATPVTNPWYYGYGLRITPHGPLYNVSGRHAVEILLRSGKRVRIGTDEPEALEKAVNRAIQ